MTERAQTWRTAALAGFSFALLYSVVMGLLQQKPPTSSTELLAVMTAFLGNAIFFGLFTGLFLRSPIVPKVEDLALDSGETLIKTGLANHFRNFEARGGRLAITNTHLRFIPHGCNIQRSGLKIPIEDVVNVNAVRTWKIVPNGIAVKPSSGKVERFVVNDRLTWMDLLNSKKK